MNEVREALKLYVQALEARPKGQSGIILRIAGL